MHQSKAIPALFLSTILNFSSAVPVPNTLSELANDIATFAGYNTHTAPESLGEPESLPENNSLFQQVKIDEDEAIELEMEPTSILSARPVSSSPINESGQDEEHNIETQTEINQYALTDPPPGPLHLLEFAQISQYLIDTGLLDSFNVPDTEMMTHIVINTAVAEKIALTEENLPKMAAILKFVAHEWELMNDQNGSDPFLDDLDEEAVLLEEIKVDNATEVKEVVDHQLEEYIIEDVDPWVALKKKENESESDAKQETEDEKDGEPMDLTEKYMKVLDNVASYLQQQNEEENELSIEENDQDMVMTEDMNNGDYEYLYSNEPMPKEVTSPKATPDNTNDVMTNLQVLLDQDPSLLLDNEPSEPTIVHSPISPEEFAYQLTAEPEELVEQDVNAILNDLHDQALKIIQEGQPEMPLQVPNSVPEMEAQTDLAEQADQITDEMVTNETHDILANIGKSLDTIDSVLMYSDKELASLFDDISTQNGVQGVQEFFSEDLIHEINQVPVELQEDVQEEEQKPSAQNQYDFAPEIPFISQSAANKMYENGPMQLLHIGNQIMQQPMPVINSWQADDLEEIQAVFTNSKNKLKEKNLEKNYTFVQEEVQEEEPVMSTQDITQLQDKEFHPPDSPFWKFHSNKKMIDGYKYEDNRTPLDMSPSIPQPVPEVKEEWKFIKTTEGATDRDDDHESESYPILPPLKPEPQKSHGNKISLQQESLDDFNADSLALLSGQYFQTAAITTQPMGSGTPSSNLPNVGLIAGKDIVKDIIYYTDGNFKLTITLSADEPICFDNLIAGKCDVMNSGLDIENPNTNKVTLVIDLDSCHPDFDGNNNYFSPAMKFIENGFFGNSGNSISKTPDMESSIEDLNKPIDIMFSLIRESDNVHLASYHLQPHTNYKEDYIIDFESQSGLSSQVAINKFGDFESIKDNLQFSFNTFTNDLYTVKNPNAEINLNYKEKSLETFMEITPSNGYTLEHMLTIPEVCTMTDLTNNDQLILWDMNEKACVKGLKFEEATGAWRFALNFNDLVSAPSEKIVVSCNIHVCNNEAGNSCSDKIMACEYDQAD